MAGRSIKSERGRRYRLLTTHDLAGLAQQGIAPDNPAVVSVNGQIGIVVLSAPDVGAIPTSDTSIAKYNAQGTFLKSQQVMPQINTSVSGTITPDCSLSNTFEFTITGNVIIANPINTTAGQFINFLILENATGGYTITLDTKFKVMNGTSFTTTANAVNILSGYVASNGNIYCNISQ